MTTTDMFAQPSTGSTNPDNAAYSADGKPDRWGRYRLPDPISGRMTGWTRATTFAKTVSDTYTLNMWGRRMTTVGLVQRPDLLAMAAGLDVANDRDTLNKIAERAAEHAGSKSAANLGTALHGFTEQEDRGESPFIPAPWDRDVAAYRATLIREGISILPGMIEGLVACERWELAGTFDRIVDDPANPCPVCGRTVKIGDLKTGRDLSYGWLEIAVQLAVYAQSKLIFDKATKSYVPMPEVCQHEALVMHLPVGKAECTLWTVDIAAGAELGDLCAAVREARKRKGLALPRAKATALPPGQGGPAVVIDRPPTYAERIAVARTSAELSAIWAEAEPAGEWTDALRDLGMARLAELKNESGAAR